MSSELTGMDELCSTISCRYGRIKPKATWVHPVNGDWGCFQCAQNANRGFLQMAIKSGCEVRKVYIPGEEYVFGLLSKST